MNNLVKVGFLLIIVLLVIGILVSFLNNTTGSTLIGAQVSGNVYEQLVSLSDQGYNVTAQSNLNTLQYNFSSVNGKPAVIYVGAEWCPFCGAERWALILALLRFGNFTNLEYMLSSSSDEYPNTPTFTFVNSTYTSKYVTFYPIEYQNRQHQQLESVPSAVYQMWKTYANFNIPFVIIGYYYQVGTPINPGLLSGRNWSYVILQLHDPNSPIYKEVYAQANLITMYICKVDGNNPASVCDHFDPNTTMDPMVYGVQVSQKGWGNSSDLLFPPLVVLEWRKR
ncbi:DUF929 domain-containing protein [Metallosphaera tengchongensis]|uniref:DUF929 domain-containing protein n=1 Tax=Metallosphaera tengchongensis TaxID=1532350 RepID=A0A6N0NT47_9CREN|nr:DUF929 family protein [Metallosphaera tengchongensis]QKQ99028.1 DUF929 domain-containing protein [Metallosphaera tengchongensis]